MADQQGFTIELPSGPRLNIELLQQLADLNAPESIKKMFKVGFSSESLSKSLSSEIASGRFPRTQVSLVSLLSCTMGIELQWPPIVSSCAERLRAADLGTNETLALISLLLSAKTVAKSEDGLNALRELSTRGHLSHLLHQHQSIPAVRACILAATMLANPTFVRDGQLNQSQAGDDLYNNLTAAKSFGPMEVENIANVVSSLEAGTFLFQVGATNQKIGALAAAVIGQLVRLSYTFVGNPEVILEQRKFLEIHSGFNPIPEFLARVEKVPQVLGLLTTQPFEVDRAQFYRAALVIASEHPNEGTSFVVQLKKGVLDLDKTQWEQALIANAGQYWELLALAADLHAHDESFELSTPARDAALAQIRNCGSGSPPPTDEIRERLSALLKLLPGSLLSSLGRDVVDDMVASSANPTQMNRLIETIGDHVEFEEDEDSDRIVRRIFTPIVTKPAEVSARWMATRIGNKLELFNRLPEETKEQFGWRLRTALQDRDKLAAGTTDALTNTAGLLKIDLSPEATDDGNSTPDEGLKK